MAPDRPLAFPSVQIDGVAIPDFGSEQWRDWGARLGGLPLDLGHPEVLPPGLRAICEPEGFTWSPRSDADNLLYDDDAGELTVSLDGDLGSASFGHGGRVSRDLRLAEHHARHERFFLPDAAVGMGLGRTVLQRATQLYMALGIEVITLRAENIGKYAWARLGFQFASDEDRVNVNEKLREFACDELGLWDDLPFVAEPWQLPLVVDEDDSGLVTVPAAAINAALEARYAQQVFAPPIVEGELLASKALLLYADYEHWNGVLPLDPDNDGFRLLWGTL